MTTSHSKASNADFLGWLIHVGDTVVYPVRQGSAMWLVEACVLEVKIGRIKVEAEGQKPSWVSRLDRVVVVES